MTKEEISAANSEIARFMGAKFTLIHSHTPNVQFDKHPNRCRNSNTTSMHPKNLQYHKSWDWLMPVVEKIQSIDITPPPNYRGYRIEIIVGGYVQIEGFPMNRILKNVSLEGGNINALYKAVIQFIKQKNQ